jgi:hypothetical protein
MTGPPVYVVVPDIVKYKYELFSAGFLRKAYPRLRGVRHARQAAFKTAFEDSF